MEAAGTHRRRDGWLTNSLIVPRNPNLSQRQLDLRGATAPCRN